MASISGAFHSGLQGIQGGFDGMRRSAGRIAGAGGPDRSGDVARPLVELVADRARIEAGVKVVQAADAMHQTIGGLLDVKA